MLRQTIIKTPMIAAILIIQLVPLMIYPTSSFSPNSQEWWLPAVLTVLSVIGIIEILANRKSEANWGWHLISFSQGFNLISRLLTLFPHFTMNVKGVQQFNTQYVILTAFAMLCSIFMLWYVELPEVKVGMLKD